MASEQHQVSSSFSVHWEYLLTTTVLSICSALLVSSLATLRSERYTQLIVGSITWNSDSKQADYLLLVSLVIGFFVIYLGLNKLAQSIRQTNGEDAEFAFRSLLVYALLPCGIAIGKVLVTLDGSVLEFLIASLFLCGFAIALATILVVKRLPNISYQEYTEVIGGSLLYLLFSALVGNTLMFAVGRVNLSWQITDKGQIEWISGITAVLLWLPMWKVWATRSLNFTRLRSQVRFLLWAVQITFPFFFLVLLPDPAIVGENKLYSYRFTLALPILIALSVVITYIDWLRRARSRLEEECQPSVFSAISPIGLIGLLLYLKAPIQGLHVLSTDDYHWGEFFLPWWLWRQFNLVPFWDYEPARGLINYLMGVLANLFYGDTAVAYQAIAGSTIWTLPFLSLCFVALYRTVGILPAFLACLLMPMNNGITEIDSLMVAALCGLGTAFFARTWTRWLLAWSITGIALILFAPAQAGLLLLSTLPIAGFCFVQALRKDRQNLKSIATIGVPIFLLGCGLTPLGKMLFGAIRYVREQSSINSVAHGVSWSRSLNTNPVLSYSLWEILRVAWIPIGVLAGLFLLKAVVDKTWVERERYPIFGIPILLLTVLLIPRAAGRIDPGDMPRLGLASIMAVCLFLPIVLVTAYGQRRKALSLFLVALFGGVFAKLQIPILPVAPLIIHKPAQVASFNPVNWSDANRLGLPNLADTWLDPTQFDRLAKIKSVLTAVVDPGETYLDLTNRNAHYFYLGYRPPIQASAFYNLVHRNQQKRALQQLEADPPPIVLASAENLLPDGIPVSLRSYLLYRYGVERYTPIKIQQFIYLVRPDRLPRLLAQLPKITGTTAPKSTIDPEERFKLLDEVFQAKDLKAIPRSWGASFDSLKSELKLVKEIPKSEIVQFEDIELAGRSYRITGKDPFVVYDVGNLKLDGQNAGILMFDFATRRQKPTHLAVYWGSRSTGIPSEKTVVHFLADTGKVIVPLDAAPRWLLAKGINQIRFDVVDLPPGAKFSVSNVALFQRSEVEERSGR
jgi:hypothetical protein